MTTGKFSNPFGSGSVYVSQTYHWGSNNRAVDFGSKPAGTAVYAIADGVMSTQSSGAGSYCILDVDDSDFRIFYVHTYKWLPKGSKVKKGQKICEVAPSSVNGGYAVHLHLGLGMVNGSYPYLMDYFDRDIVFKTTYNDIAADWFITKDKIDWNKFKDYYYMSQFIKGDNIEFKGDSNVRFGPANDRIAYLAPKGSIGKIKDGPRTADGHEWWDLQFLNCPDISKHDSGWVANVNGSKFVKTSKEITCLNGEYPSPGPTCEEQLSDALKTIDTLTADIDTKKEEIKALEKSLEAEKEMNYKKIHTDNLLAEVKDRIDKV